MDNGTAIPAHRTACKACMADNKDGLVLKTPAVPIIGEDPKLRLGQAIEVLQKHLAKKHPDIWKNLFEQSKQHMMFLGFSCFQTEDPALLGLWNIMRHDLRKRTERYTFEDQALRANISKIEDLSESQQEQVFVLLTDLRDVLLEQGRYALLQNHPAPNDQSDVAH